MKHFKSQFSENKLLSLQEDNLIILEENQLTVTDIGRLLIRNIVMNFDYYLMKKQGEKPQFSRTV